MGAQQTNAAKDSSGIIQSMNLESRNKVSKDDVLGAIGDQASSAEKQKLDLEVQQFENLLNHVRNGRDVATAMKNVD